MVTVKKITKKKLREPDEFITFTQRAYLFITQHSKKIMIGAIVVFVLLLTTLIYQRWERKNEEDASRKFSSSMEIYQMASSPYQEGSASGYKAVLEKFDEIIAKFPRTSSGKLSLLYKGNVHLWLGEFEEAAKSYQTFLERGLKEKLYRLLATEGLGYAHEGKKEYEKALQAFQKIVEEGETFQSANAYLSIGRCYERLGKNKEALENYKAFLKASQKSMMTNAMLRKISILENLVGQ